MINGIGSNGGYPLQNGSGVVRERSDGARNPAASPEKTPSDVEQTLARAPSDNGTEDFRRPESLSDRELQRRVEARQAAADVRLERFSGDELPLSTARALSTFSAVASQGSGHDTELAGIDIRI
ncbi:hypothetical protein [Marinobacter mobilis]|uniref:UDP pyrophosphate phosphatase n=1 Tax=Marinobacter mobilis TaxID=488533 RepID=A0A1H3A0X7_9GAMM|nr:hypothetical protein [Marinobacter mobilis]SDX23295.1 hypothetical protein SAMN04487960_107150 [Marinobacter mobilis]